MLILPGALPVAPPPEQAFAVQPAPSPVKTVTAVVQSEKSRNETGADTGPHTGGQNSAKLAPIPDPDRPTGPPPTFEANLLETEREKLRAGPELEVKEEQPADVEKADEPYAQPPLVENHEVDIAL